MFEAKEYCTCKGPEAGVPLACCAAARNPGLLRVAGGGGGGRALGEEAKEVERPSSKEAQKTVPRTWSFTLIEMEPICILKRGGVGSDRGLSELIQGPLWRMGYSRAALGGGEGLQLGGRGEVIRWEPGGSGEYGGRGMILNISGR